MRTLITFILLGILAACSKPEVPAAPPAEETKLPSGLERIPGPDPTTYPRLQEMNQWKNPQLVVREDGIGLVDFDNHEVRILTPEQIPAELATLPLSAWPYGRVVLVGQAAPSDSSEQTKARLRETRGLLMGTLKELQVQVREAP